MRALRLPELSATEVDLFILNEERKTYLAESASGLLSLLWLGYRLKRNRLNWVTAPILVSKEIPNSPENRHALAYTVRKRIARARLREDGPIMIPISSTATLQETARYYYTWGLSALVPNISPTLADSISTPL